MQIDEIPDVGLFSWDIAENILHADSALAELFGLDPLEAEHGLPIEVYLERVHPDDRPRLAKVISQSITQHTNQNEKYRVKKVDGNYVDVESFARAFRDRSGNPVRYVGIVVRSGGMSLAH